MADRWVEFVRLDEIRPATRNPKAHAADEIGNSIGHFGLAELPLIDDRTGQLVAGHGRLNDLMTRRAAGAGAPDGVRVDDDGQWLVPVLRGWSSRSDEDAEAYLLASNNLTTLGGWDAEGLAEMLRDLATADADLAALTGWNTDEIDQMVGAPTGDPPDDFPEYDEKTIVTEHTCPSCGYQWSGGKVTVGGE